MSVVELLNPNDLDPEETHEYGMDEVFVVDEVPGAVFDRGYTVPNEIPTYAVICDDNVQRTFTADEIGSDRVEYVGDDQ